MYNLGVTFAGIQKGEWADASIFASPQDPVIGYLVEYETSSLTRSIPEPASLPLLAAASWVLWRRRRRAT